MNVRGWLEGLGFGQYADAFDANHIDAPLLRDLSGDDLRELGVAFGATPIALLLKVELPHARAAILAGATECIMLSLSMVVIAALVGAQGLGEPVVRALNTVNIAQGFEAGLAIVILAIVLDRTLRRVPHRLGRQR